MTKSKFKLAAITLSLYRRFNYVHSGQDISYYLSCEILHTFIDHNSVQIVLRQINFFIDYQSVKYTSITSKLRHDPKV